MTNLRLASTSLLFISVIVAACTDDPATQPPIDPPRDIPIDPSGHYAVTSSFALASVPAPATEVLAELAAATDGSDDPSRYLIDLMIAKLPEGPTRTYATVVAPYVAAYLNLRIATVAPKFMDGARALSNGLTRIAQRFGTSETFAIEADAAFDADEIASLSSDGRVGSLRRAIVGFRFDLHAGRDVAEVGFAPLGMPDLTGDTRVVLDGETLVFDRHTIALPYTRLLRLGFDFAVIPDVVPGAHDLAKALAELVDCDQLGVVVSDWIGLGSPSFYATGCKLGLTALASRIYDRIAAIDAAALPLDAGGEAWAVDVNGDGPMDSITRGTWTGDFAGIAITSSFEGSRR
ncbi:MAG TPA: hypothetical protein VIV11_43165 [Kofleriaceae bacterium]